MLDKLLTVWVYAVVLGLVLFVVLKVLGGFLGGLFELVRPFTKEERDRRRAEREDEEHWRDIAARFWEKSPTGSPHLEQLDLSNPGLAKRLRDLRPKG